MIGTEIYLAPEVRGFISDDEAEEGHDTYSLAVDIWAIGAIVFRMITGRMAFQNPRDLFNYVVSKAPFPADSSISSDCHRFVVAAMDASARKRPTAEEALEQPWIKRHLSNLPTITLGLLPLVSPKLEEQESTISAASAAWSDTNVPTSRSYESLPKYV